MSIFDQPARRPGPPPRPPRPGRSRAVLVTAAVMAALLVGGSIFSAFWTEKLWFGAAGYGGVFSTLVWMRIGLFAVFGLAMALVVGVNLYIGYRLRPFFAPTPEVDATERYRLGIEPVKTWLLVGLSVVMGVFAGASASGQWRTFALWRNSVDFGTKDAYFDKDVSFYVFQLPWFHYLTDYVMALAVVGLMAAVVVHYVYGGIRLQARQDRLTGAAQAQISVLLGIFVLAKAVDYWLDRYDLMNASGGVIDGMSYTGEHAVLPAKNILLGIAVICAVLFFLNVWRRTWMLPSVGIALLALSAILLGVLWPGIVQKFQVDPSPADKEASYIAKNIEATRTAYDVADTTVSQYTSTPDLNASLGDLDGATSSVPLLDPKAMRKAFEQQQQVRAYYSVAPVLDVDRYEIDGRQRAMVVAARELDQNGVAEADRNWENLHTVYTHGSGLIAAYANQRPADDLKQSTSLQWAEGQEPNERVLSGDSEDYEGRIYFGQMSPNYSIVGKAPGGRDVELALQEGDGGSSETTSYDGDGGVEIGSFFRKLLYAVKFSEPKIVLGERVHENSKILYDRDPRVMVEKVAPWLTVDTDPYPALVDGRITWILDGYTVTDRYPQSQKGSLEEMTDDALNQRPQFATLPTDEINYMRNSVKATVDAYDGTVSLYAWDEEDPMLKAWSGVFPDVVKPKSEIPESLQDHLRYPEDLFKVQRFQLARYHVTEPKDWFEGRDRWEVPEDPNVDGRLQPPYRLFVNQSGERDDSGPTEGVSADQTYSLTSVYVPRGRNQMAAFVSVNSDATSPEYGKIQALQLPNERENGPTLIANEIASDEEVRKQLLSFSQGRIKPIYGNLLTVPVGDGLMFVQPLYAAQNESEAAFPILRFVMVSYGEKVGIAPTLTGAIADVLGVSLDDTPTPDDGDETAPTGTVAEQIRNLLQRADAKYREADEAQKAGNTVKWAKANDEARALIDEAFALAQKQADADEKAAQESEEKSGN